MEMTGSLSRSNSLIVLMMMNVVFNCVVKVFSFFGLRWWWWWWWKWKKNITGRDEKKSKNLLSFKIVHKHLIIEDCHHKLVEVMNLLMFSIVLPWPNEFHVKCNDTIDICHAYKMHQCEKLPLNTNPFAFVFDNYRSCWLISTPIDFAPTLSKIIRPKFDKTFSRVWQARRLFLKRKGQRKKNVISFHLSWQCLTSGNEIWSDHEWPEEFVCIILDSNRV